MSGLWASLPAEFQDILLFFLMLLPGVLVGLFVLAGHRPWKFVKALLWRYRWTNALFILLIALSVGLGVAIIAQERGLRQGMARAADKFDLILAAPGSQVDMTLAVVYLQPRDVPLLGGDIMAEITQEPQVDLASPIAYGDSHKGCPVIGSTTVFIRQLSGALAVGRHFSSPSEAVVGGRVSLEIGDVFTPAHGQGSESEEHLHHGSDITVVGKMAMTGSPWDKAILVPIEMVWMVHGMGTGHAPGDDRLGPPFDPQYFPGTPAIIVRATKLWANYALASKYTREEVMAFFPGTVLARLHGLIGNVRQVMSLMAILSQVLVAAGVMAGLVALARLFTRRFALLRALGAPQKFVFSVMWTYTAGLIGAGSLLGVLLGFASVAVVSGIITERTDILVRSSLSWPEFHLVAAFFSVSVILALFPGFAAYRRDVVADLRAQ